MDQTVNGDGTGFPRLVEPPAVKPASANPTNNVNVVALSYIPDGMSIHYQTPFGLGEAPSIQWGTTATDLDYHATGYSHTYVPLSLCSFLDLSGLWDDLKYTFWSIGCHAGESAERANWCRYWYNSHTIQSPLCPEHKSDFLRSNGTH